jgi:hypothetical protein
MRDIAKALHGTAPDSKSGPTLLNHMTILKTGDASIHMRSMTCRGFANRAGLDVAEKAAPATSARLPTFTFA